MWFDISAFCYCIRRRAHTRSHSHSIMFVAWGRFQTAPFEHGTPANLAQHRTVECVGDLAQATKLLCQVSPLRQSPSQADNVFSGAFTVPVLVASPGRGGRRSASRVVRDGRTGRRPSSYSSSIQTSCRTAATSLASAWLA